MEPGEDIYNQPYEATTFHSHGHYGSTAFDPVTGEQTLEINICDTCLVKRKKRVLHVRPIQPARPVLHYDVRSWDPESD